jgi:hypothetical protein
MNNLTWSGKSSEDKKPQIKKEDTKKKKISYTKEIEDLEKIYTKIKEKYDLHPHNRVSNALIDLSGVLESLKKFEY